MGSFWSQPIRVECTDKVQLITAKLVNSLLWFINNKQLEHMILAYLAKYADKYQVKLYSFTLVGNHYHLEAGFPCGNRAHFCRDFNARVAQAVNHCVSNFPGGTVFASRYTPQVLMLDEDVEDYFFYCALQSVKCGLCERISEYGDYNSFSDASSGIVRKFKLFNYGKYHAAKRSNPAVVRKDFEEEHELRFERLPGYENLSNKEYREILNNKLESRRVKLVQERIAENKSFLGKDRLKKIIPGTCPLNPKVGGIRPLVLSVSREARKSYLDAYFSLVSWYRDAVSKYRRGFLNVEFPPGTFRPPGLCINSS